MPVACDVNADLGESFGHWTLGDDAALVEHITSANVACGFHAGDFRVLDRTVQLCRDRGVGVGAQPGYPDLLGFGRRPMPFTPLEIEQLVVYQVGAVHAFCRRHRIDLQHVKPHGALYNQAAADHVIAQAIARGIAGFSREIPFVGLASSGPMREAAADCGLRFVPEAFADRRYEPDGSLQSRSVPGAVISDPTVAARQAVSIVVDRRVEAPDGSSIVLDAPVTVCVHGDTPGAAGIAAAVRAALTERGVKVQPIAQLVAARATE